MAISDDLAQGVRAFLDQGDRGFLETLRGLPRDSLEGQATIRYLGQLNHWPHTPESDFAGLLEHFFGHYPNRPKVDPTEYQATTGKMILEAWAFECVVVIREPRAEKPLPKPNPGKRTNRPRMQSEEESVEEGEAHATQDLQEASERLQRVIAIQRGG